jgi:hypothetical protein
MSETFFVYITFKRESMIATVVVDSVFRISFYIMTKKEGNTDRLVEF